MRVLLIKTSSMGDVIHALPALSDAANAIPNIQFDWLVEESFAEIPTWHPAVSKVIPIAFRKWRKNLISRETFSAWQKMHKELRNQKYDLILDAQGLVKSAFLSFFARGLRVGLDFKSARESFASFAYQKKCTVNFYQHAIVRMRMLFNQALSYSLPNTLPNFGLNHAIFADVATAENYLVFLHGTTWNSKLWPESYWLELAKIAAANDFRIKMSGGNAEELARTERLAQQCDAIDVIPRLTITAMANLLANAKAAVAVDTGLGHLAAALNVPTISLYGSTNAEFTGAIGNFSKHLSADFSCAPCLNRECTFKGETAVKPACFAQLSPQKVWGELMAVIPRFMRGIHF